MGVFVRRMSDCFHVEFATANLLAEPSEISKPKETIESVNKQNCKILSIYFGEPKMLMP